jgi:hypothetical protein
MEAATFSDDIDVWVEPSEENLERCRLALRKAGARYYKLTPGELRGGAGAALLHGGPSRAAR